MTAIWNLSMAYQRYGSEQGDDQLEAETDEEIKKIHQDYESNQNKVIDLLIDRVINVHLEFPQVLKGNYDVNFK